MRCLQPPQEDVKLLQQLNHSQDTSSISRKSLRMGTRLLLDRMMQHFQRILASPPFTRYLLVTNVVSGAIIDFTGDLITQKKVECAESTNWSRSGRMVTVGLVMSPLAHYWYIYLDRLFPLKSPRSIAKKLAVDSLVGGPIFLGGFYLGK